MDVSENFLNIAPEFDEATQYSIKWDEELIRQADPQPVTHLLRDDATRAQFEKWMPLADFLIFYDHGDENSLVAQGGTEAILDLDNVSLVDGKSVYTMACLSAKNLGIVVFKRGSKLFWGYYEVVAFDTANEKLFMRAVNSGLIFALVSKLPWEECYRLTIEEFNKCIAEADNFWTQALLASNRDALRCYTPNMPPPIEDEACFFRRLAVRLFGKRGWHILARR